MEVCYYLYLNKIGIQFSKTKLREEKSKIYLNYLNEIFKKYLSFVF